MSETSLPGLAKLYLFLPKRGAAAARKTESWLPSLWLYAAFLLGSLIFYWLKPWDFPDVNAPYPQQLMGLFFWIKVMIWQPPLEIVWILFALGLAVWLRAGNFIVKLAAAVLWTALPFILVVCYARYPSFPRWAFIVLTLAWLSPFVPLLRRVAAADWRPVLAFMLGTNVIGLVLIAPLAVSVFWRISNLFYAAQIAGGFWILAVSCVGLKELMSLRLPRAFMAVLLSLFLQIAFAFALHMAGLVPMQILKALLYS
ncbi:MAG TPA: hypothetical protein VNK24_03875 [Elusimicrobiota bacterium]|nr:hypothetical protein [Elusimicrobiota bacterium]